jgi:hypothetical protein
MQLNLPFNWLELALGSLRSEIYGYWPGNAQSYRIRQVILRQAQCRLIEGMIIYRWAIPRDFSPDLVLKNETGSRPDETC